MVLLSIIRWWVEGCTIFQGFPLPPLEENQRGGRREGKVRGKKGKGMEGDWEREDKGEKKRKGRERGSEREENEKRMGRGREKGRMKG